MTPAQAKSLKPKLPFGWLAKAQEKLAAKGKSFSEGTISKVKNARHQNDDIELVLLEVADEEALRVARLDERIAAL